MQHLAPALHHPATAHVSPSCLQPLPHLMRLGISAGLVLALLGCSTPAPPARETSERTLAPAPPSASAASTMSANISANTASLVSPTSTQVAPPPPHQSAVPESDALQARCAAWIQAFRPEARAAGIADAILDAAFGPAQCLPRVVAADRSQPEFTRPIWAYLDIAVSPSRVTRGLTRMAEPEVQSALQGGSARHGVPMPLLAAFWGLESDFGRDSGRIPVIDALVTLGVDGRREALARRELLAALRILQAGDADRSQLVGSWAGAMGQTQFMPSTFLTDAVDADGDGRRDLWTSLPDVMTSTAQYLARRGWRADEPWGQEVLLPDGFAPHRADASVKQSSAAWAAEGLRPARPETSSLASMDQAWIFQPAGHRGPAFLVGHNWRVILRYNASDSYALAIGLLSDRLAGRSHEVTSRWPRDLQVLSRTQIQAMQTALAELGFSTGPADGVMGPATRTALRAWQRREGLPADGFATLDLLQKLQATVVKPAE